MNEIKLSRPSFAELVSALSKSGMSDALCEDGKLRIGNLELMSSDDVFATPGRAARLATQISDAAAPHQPNEAIYEKNGIRILTRCKENGVHLIRLHDHDSTTQGAIIPYAALVDVASDLIDCLAREPKIETCVPMTARAQ